MAPGGRSPALGSPRASAGQSRLRPQLVLLVSWALLGIALTASAAPKVWLAPSLVRVRPSDPAGATTQLELHAARRETESFQIIVQAPPGGLSNVTVAAEYSGGPEATLYREHYVYITPGTTDWYTNRNRPEGPGWYPDGLIPFIDPATGQPPVGGVLTAAPFDLAEEENQPIWVDLYVPPDLPAGNYVCPFTVTSDEGNTSVTVNLRVWHFALPLAPAMKSCFLVYHDFETRTQANLELLRNRIMPSWVDRNLERSLIDDYGLNCSNLGFFSHSSVLDEHMDPPPPVAEVEEEIARHEPDLYLYNYSADEVYITGSTMFFDLIKEWGRTMHEAGVDNLVAAPPVPELQDDGSGTGRSAVDIWAMLPKVYDVFYYNVWDVLAKGDKCWSYNTLVQDDYSPKWQMDFAPINFRIQPGFINQSLDLTGLLCWGVDEWTADTWNHPYGGYDITYPGEALFVYPGTEAGLVGVAPSMRLKYLRDGVDDYDYIQLLKEQGYADWALSIARAIGPNWSDWTRDPVALEAARLQLGYKLDELAVPPTVVVAASADSTSLASGETTNLDATATDTFGHSIVAWSWSDGGAGGSFSPSASIPNPAYTAPQNSTSQAKTVILMVTATCDGVPSASGRAFVSLSVLPPSHTVTVTASASPGIIPSGGSTTLSASAVDNQDHGGLAWSWSDNDAGGTFSPSNTVANPTYVAPTNSSGSDRTVTLTASATCKWYHPWASGSAEVPLTVWRATVFSDVLPDHWAYDEVEACADAGIVAGYGDGLYHPELPVARDQMAVYISRALAGGDDYVPGFTDTPTFPDIGSEHWALDYVEYAVSQNVVAGYDDGTYHPEHLVTRDQMAVYVARAICDGTGEDGLAGYVPADPRNFADVASDFWSYRHVEYCVENGVVAGYLDGYYHPEIVVTRDQMAVYVARAFGLGL